MGSDTSLRERLPLHVSLEARSQLRQVPHRSRDCTILHGGDKPVPNGRRILPHLSVTATVAHGDTKVAVRLSDMDTESYKAATRTPGRYREWLRDGQREE
jgi:hypothetical protein